ncbi:MAG: YbaN family protein [Bacteroidales bacterium]|nr:YbaN family protein [Bacteroidales bacterium]
MKRIVYIILGLLCVGLGALGVVVPGLPTTPFLLLASWLFYRSSPRLQEWLLHSWLGTYIRSYRRRGGMTAAQKAGACGIMVAMVLLSTFVFIPKGSVARIIVPIAGAVGVLTVIFAVPRLFCPTAEPVCCPPSCR